jgi:hypothetical protein
MGACASSRMPKLGNLSVCSGARNSSDGVLVEPSYANGIVVGGGGGGALPLPEFAPDNFYDGDDNGYYDQQQHHNQHHRHSHSQERVISPIESREVRKAVSSLKPYFKELFMSYDVHNEGGISRLRFASFYRDILLVKGYTLDEANKKSVSRFNGMGRRRCDIEFEDYYRDRVSNRVLFNQWWLHSHTKTTHLPTTPEQYYAAIDFFEQWQPHAIPAPKNERPIKGQGRGGGALPRVRSRSDSRSGSRGSRSRASSTDRKRARERRERRRTRAASRDAFDESPRPSGRGRSRGRLSRRSSRARLGPTPPPTGMRRATSVPASSSRRRTSQNGAKSGRTPRGRGRARQRVPAPPRRARSMYAPPMSAVDEHGLRAVPMDAASMRDDASSQYDPHHRGALHESHSSFSALDRLSAHPPATPRSRRTLSTDSVGNARAGAVMTVYQAYPDEAAAGYDDNDDFGGYNFDDDIDYEDALEAQECASVISHDSQAPYAYTKEGFARMMRKGPNQHPYLSNFGGASNVVLRDMQNSPLAPAAGGQ